MEKKEIINKNNFKKVFVFDKYDYDYKLILLIMIKQIYSLKVNKNKKI